MDTINLLKAYEKEIKDLQLLVEHLQPFKKCHVKLEKLLQDMSQLTGNNAKVDIDSLKQFMVNNLF